MKQITLISKRGITNFTDGNLPYYKYAGTTEDLFKDLKELPVNATYMTTNGAVWTFEKSEDESINVDA